MDMSAWLTHCTERFTKRMCYLFDDTLTNNTRVNRISIEMTGVYYNLDTVDSMLTELEDRYREVPVEREPVDVSVGAFEDHLQNARNEDDGGAYAWVIRDPEDARQRPSTTRGER